MEKRLHLPKRALVIGAGVSGLSTGVSLLKDGWLVKIVAEKVSPNTTSDGVAAFWEPFLSEPEEKVYQWSKDALEEFLHIRDAHPEAGVWLASGYDLCFEEVQEKPRWLELVENRELKSNEIPKGYKSGRFFSSPMIEIPIYMPWLTKLFLSLGGTIEVRKINSFPEAAQDPFKPSIVVNCTGLGSKELCKDNEMYPIRGQVLKVVAPWVKNFYIRSESEDDLMYIFPRSDCVVLGGSAQKHDFGVDIDEKLTQDILNRCDQVCPGLKDAKIKAKWTGLRPGRSQVRLDSEYIAGIPVIHNYGHGGSGVTMSWGCSKEVVRIARVVHRDVTKTLQAKL